MGVGAPLARPYDAALPVLRLAGLGWCGGWRRANLRGSHDQGKIKVNIKAQAGNPYDVASARQAPIEQTVRESLPGTNR